MSEIIGNYSHYCSFLLLIFLVKEIYLEQYQWYFRARAKITDDIDGAESARQRAEELASKREEELAGSRKEAASIVENAKETAKEQISVLSETTQAVRLKKSCNKFAHNKALNSIQRRCGESHCQSCQQLLSQQLDAEGQRQLIDRYLDELGEALMDKKQLMVIDTPAFCSIGLWKRRTDLVFEKLFKSRLFWGDWTC